MNAHPKSRSHAARRAEWLLSAALATWTAAACSPEDTPLTSPNLSDETWTAQLDQTSGGAKGRIWFTGKVSLREDPAQGTCLGYTVTTMLGNFAGPVSRIRTPAPGGTVIGSWTNGSAGKCDVFSMTISPTGESDFVLKGQTTSSYIPLKVGFSPMPSMRPVVQGTWSSDGRSGDFYLYRSGLSYMPDSHFDLRVTVTEKAGCPPVSIPKCDVVFNPAARLCLDSRDKSLQFSCHGWLADTTFLVELPRQTSKSMINGSSRYFRAAIAVSQRFTAFASDPP